MKKFQLNLIILLLLPLGAMADNVLFKMVTINSNAIHLPDTIDEVPTRVKSLSNNTFIIGGTAEIYSGRSDAGKDNHSANSKVRLLRKEDYIHIALDRPIKEGDIISLANDNEGLVHDFYVTKTATRSSGNEVTAGENPVSLTVSSGHTFIGATDLYFWWGGNSAGIDSEGKSLSNYRYVKMLTITTSDPEVKYYDFEGETVETIFSPGKELVNGLKLNAIATEGVSNGIISQSSNGFTKMANIVGDGAGRSLELPVTDPCTIEAWVIGSAADRSLQISDNKSNLNKDSLITSTDDNHNKLTYCSFHYDFYEGFPENPILYINSGAGAWKIAAIRVIYDKIRPAADLTASATDVYMRVGDRKSVQLTTSSDVAITRSRPDQGVGTGNIGNLNVDDATHTYTFTATALGDYVMRLSQAASEDYRAASVDVNIHIQESVESVSTLDKTLSPNNTSVLTSGNITLIGEDADAKIDNGNDAYVSNSIKLLRNKSYTISVPTNCIIKSAKFTGMTNDANKTSDDGEQGYVTINDVNSSTFQYVKINGVKQDPVEYTFSDINASSVTFKVANKANLIVTIDLTVEEGSNYPVTIASGWATFYNHDDFVQMPEGMTAYYATSCNGSEILLSEVEGQVIRPDRAVVLFGTDGAGELQVISNPGEGHFDSFTSALSGTAKRIALPSGTIYCLNGEQGAFQQYTGAYIPANKAYYKYTAPAGAPAHIPFRIVQQDNTATGIENTEFVPIDYSAPIYNLQGQQVQVTESGIYMQNGRKYLIMK